MHFEFFIGKENDIKEYLKNVLFFCVFIAFGMFISFMIELEKENCTEIVDARVVDVEVSYSKSRKGTKSTVYTPVYEFEFNGEKHTVASRTSSGFNSVDIGDNVKLNVNPDNVQEVFCSEQNKSIKLIAIILKLIGFGFGALYLFFAIRLFIRKYILKLE